MDYIISNHLSLKWIRLTMDYIDCIIYIIVNHLSEFRIINGKPHSKSHEQPPFFQAFPMVFQGVPMVFQGFPMVFYGFPMVFYGFPMVFQGFSPGRNQTHPIDFPHRCPKVNQRVIVEGKLDREDPVTWRSIRSPDENGC